MSHRWITAMLMSRPGSLLIVSGAQYQVHSANGAIAWLILHYLRVHGAGIFFCMMLVFHNEILFTAILSPDEDCFKDFI
jgi:hypothetical protein